MEFHFSYSRHCNRIKQIARPEPHRVPPWLPPLQSKICPKLHETKEETKAQEKPKTLDPSQKKEAAIFENYFLWLLKRGMRFNRKVGRYLLSYGIQCTLEGASKNIQDHWPKSQ